MGHTPDWSATVPGHHAGAQTWLSAPPVSRLLFTSAMPGTMCASSVHPPLKHETVKIIITYGLACAYSGALLGARLPPRRPRITYGVALAIRWLSWMAGPLEGMAMPSASAKMAVSMMCSGADQQLQHGTATQSCLGSGTQCLPSTQHSTLRYLDLAWYPVRELFWRACLPIIPSHSKLKPSYKCGAGTGQPGDGSQILCTNEPGSMSVCLSCSSTALPMSDRASRAKIARLLQLRAATWRWVAGPATVPPTGPSMASSLVAFCQEGDTVRAAWLPGAVSVALAPLFVPQIKPGHRATAVPLPRRPWPAILDGHAHPGLSPGGDQRGDRQAETG